MCCAICLVTTILCVWQTWLPGSRARPLNRRHLKCRIARNLPYHPRLRPWTNPDSWSVSEQRQNYVHWDLKYNEVCQSSPSKEMTTLTLQGALLSLPWITVHTESAQYLAVSTWRPALSRHVKGKTLCNCGTPGSKHFGWQHSVSRARQEVSIWKSFFFRDVAYRKSVAFSLFSTTRSSRFVSVLFHIFIRIVFSMTRDTITNV